MVGVAPPLYVRSASTDNGLARSRFTSNGHISDRPQFLNIYSKLSDWSIGSWDSPWTVGRMSADYRPISVGSYPIDVSLSAGLSVRREVRKRFNKQDGFQSGTENSRAGACRSDVDRHQKSKLLHLQQPELRAVQ